MSEKEPGRLIDFEARKRDLEQEKETQKTLEQNRSDVLKGRIALLEDIREKMLARFEVIRLDGPDDEVRSLEQAIEEIQEDISQGYNVLSAPKIDEKAMADFLAKEWMPWDDMPSKMPDEE